VIKRFSTIAILALAGLSGCGGTEEDSIALVRVTGLISKNGKPLADAAVVFTPAPGNTASTVGTDRTGPEGTYTLKFKNRAGVAPGNYKVGVTPAPEMPASAEESESFKNDPVMFRLREAERKGAKKGKGVARSKPTEVVKSEFEATVEPGKAQSFDFDVKATSSAKAATAKN
jgi:hypothetical protein